MRKTSTSMTLKETTIDFITLVAELNQISKSQAMDLVSDIVQDYFSNQQIALEYQSRGVSDYRKKARD